MRRGRILTGATLLLAAISLSGVPAAFAATPQDICTDLKDGVVNGSYTASEWTAFFSDPTIQGYGCGGTIVPPQTPPQTPPVTPPVTPPQTPPVTASPAPVPLTPVPVAVVKGSQHTLTTPAGKVTPGVKGAQHTVSAPVTKAAAPLGVTKASGTLPFTGAQLALFALVGAALLATGLVLRSTGKQSSR